MEEIKDYYFISCRREEKDRFSDLEELLQGYRNENKLQIQYSFPYIATVAAVIEEKGVIDELKNNGYIVEPQNILRKLYPNEL